MKRAQQQKWKRYKNATTTAVLCARSRIEAGDSTASTAHLKLDNSADAIRVAHSVVASASAAAAVASIYILCL